MPFPADKHPDDLKDAIGQTLLKGEMTAPGVVRALAAGTFPGFGEYTIPLATVRYYGQKARKHEKAAGLTTRAKGGINDAVEAMAREILSEVDQELTKVRKAKVRDLEKLGAIAKLLKECKALAPNAGPATKAGKKTAAPVDPFAAALTGSVRDVTPPPKRKAQERSKDAVSTQAAPAPAEQNTPQNTPQVLSPAAWVQ